MNLKYVAITRAKEELYFVEPDSSEDKQQALYSGTVSGT
jgi:ATP-dependent exoDNAse (exonuclease V) beta subunit